MSPNWLGTICAGGALASFYLSHRFAISATKKTRLLLALAATILAIPGATFAGYYTHAFPEPSWYYEFRSWRGTECLLVMLGIAGGLIASLLPRPLLILPLFVTAAFALAPILKPFVRPIPQASMHDTWDAGICMQSTPSTCGAASVASILNYYGVRVSERELARDAHSYVGGTEAWYLARAVRDRGCDACFRFSSGFDPEIPCPAVVGVRLDSDGHFIAILSRNGDHFQIGDPLIGREDLSRSELLERYVFTGFYMSIMKGGPANGSQPIRSETNTTSSAAGRERSEDSRR
jgi:predicted double-glycine peptidase